MPSGKRAKQQRREAATAVKAPPPVRSKGVGARPRRASGRVIGIAGGIVVLAVIGIALAFAFAGGSSGGVPKGTPTYGSVGANSLPGAAEIKALYKGIPQHGLTLGQASAPVQMVMFIDLQCPVCQNFEVTALPTVVQQYIRTGKVRLDLKPWAFIGNDSYRGRLATIAASFQNKAYGFAGVLYDNQGEENSGWLTDSMIAQIATSVPGLNVYKLFSDRNSARAKSIASQVDTLATADKVTGTPTILVGKAGGKLKDVATPGNAPTLNDVTTAIDNALAS
ncbi:MAG: DsbA family protein [Gaiellaceae bacterium]